MQIITDTHFVSLISCSAVLVFSMVLSGQLHRDMEKAVFGFFGLAWLVVASLAFLLYGAAVGVFHIFGSYLFGLLANPIASFIAGFLQGDSIQRRERIRRRHRMEPEEGPESGLLGDLRVPSDAEAENPQAARHPPVAG
jgi:hypothetical protein